MTNYIILALCLIIILAYIFDITSSISKIPGVLLLIFLGIGLQLLVGNTGLVFPDMKAILPVLGTLGIILIVMEASFDLKLKKDKRPLILKSISSAVVLFFLTTFFLAVILYFYTGVSARDSLLNSIPLGIISSAVAISSTGSLDTENREFIVYESSFSDIFGIIFFDYILLSQGTIFQGILSFGINTLVTLALAILLTAGLAFFLHKTTHHVNYVIIMTSVIMVYALAKMIHLPALLLVLAFGMILSNHKFLENTFIKQFIDFEKFGNDLTSFKMILTEVTFLVRSLFFIIFGFYVQIDGLLNLKNIIYSLVIVVIIIVLRYLFLRIVLRKPVMPLLFFSPRGLITILLFMNIPFLSRISIVSEGLITLVILFSILVLTLGNIIYRKESNQN